MKKYKVRPEAAYKDTWLAPWVGYDICLFKKAGCLHYNLMGIIDKSAGYFTKKTISTLLEPFNPQQP